MNFKAGDIVYKVKPYSPSQYCMGGGQEPDVPLGSRGVIVGMSKDKTMIGVKFDNGRSWNVASIEISDLPITRRVSRQRGAYDYVPGTSVSDYVKGLMTKIGIESPRGRWLRTFDNCVLPKEVKEAVDEAITTIFMAYKFDDWGINEHFEKGLTNSILIYGPPGTGKTMVSESIAAVLDKNLMKISSGDLQSNMPGETERNIKKAFKKAKDENAVILFDECDSILANRDSVGVIMGAEINALLTEIERFEGVCIMTTNRLHTLDPALQRRIVSKVRLDNPNEEARQQIWQKLIPPKMPIAKNIDFDELSRIDLTGGEIKNCILVAARKAVATNAKRVDLIHFVDAIKQTAMSKKEFNDTKPRSVLEQIMRQNGQGVGITQSGKDKILDVVRDTQ